jgi:hypothetical protein
VEVPKVKNLSDEFELVERLLTYFGYLMFAAAGLFFIGAALLWAYFHIKAILVVGGCTLAWLVVYLTFFNKGD